MKWLITGESRLTGERETVAGPMEREVGERLLRLAKSRQHSRSAYRRLKLQPACGSGLLFKFNTQNGHSVKGAK